MAYRYGNREQLGLLPASIEDYVSKEDAVRAYDAFVEALNFVELGIELDEGQVGNTRVRPQSDAEAIGVRVLLWGEGIEETGAGMSPQSIVCVVDGRVKAGSQDDSGVSATA